MKKCSGILLSIAVLSTSCGVSDSVASERRQRQLQLCFFIFEVNIKDERTYEGSIKVKFKLDKEYFNTRLLIEPILSGNKIFFADDCDSNLSYLDPTEKARVRESSVTEFREVLHLRFQELR